MLVELRVEVPGGQHARYEHDFQSGGLRLTEVLYPPDRFPADWCAVTETLADDRAPLGALLLGNLSHPAGCLVVSRPLGVIEIHSGEAVQCHLVAVAASDAHFITIQAIEELPEPRRNNIALALHLDGAGPPADVRWLGLEAAQTLVHEARQLFRLAQAREHDATPLEPAWKPLNRKYRPSGTSEAERHTAAEYAFYALPYRFQKYVEEYLSPRERLLYGLHRPALRSALSRTLLSRKRLEEGVFIVSDQQITEVTELMPPDRAGIRYGFIARSAAPERLENAEVVTLTQDVIGLAATWRASGGTEKVVWEFQASQRDEVETALDLVRGWLPRDSDRRARRATLPEPPEEFPPLRDPAAHDPADTKPLAARLETALAKTLGADETVLARCLLPAWLEERSAASLLTVTTRRLLVVPDPDEPKAARLKLAIPLRAIASLEFCSTLVMAYLKVFVPESERVAVHTIHFGKTLAAMSDCYLMLRRALAVISIHEKATPYA